MVRNIVIWPAEVLKSPAATVTVFDAYLWQLAVDLQETCRYHNGLGLAAPQIDVPFRVVYCLGQIYVNPKYESQVDKVLMGEGCLSFPGAVTRVLRHPEVVATYQTLHGDSVQETLSGELAHVYQHETDHVDGITIPSRLSFASRDSFLNKYKRAKRREKSSGTP